MPGQGAPMAESLLDPAAFCTASGKLMSHAGLPLTWMMLALLAMALVTLPAVAMGRTAGGRARGTRGPSLAGVPWLQDVIRQPWVLATLRISMALAFIGIIYAGLFGSPIPERNVATVITWTFWWTGVVIAVLVMGSAWCAICPWDTIAGWLAHRRLWGRAGSGASLGLRFPAVLRNLWPATLLFAGLTWLELGVGITASPYATAVLGLALVVMATVSLAVFDRKPFCHYLCPIGRTLGAYSTLSPVAVRPVDPAVCAGCTTLECYHGTAQIPACPTQLVIGRTEQNQFCTSCGACVQSCPHENVAWALRPLGNEAAVDARPRLDVAGFVIALLALTSFHGVTMLPAWELWMTGLGQWLGDSGQLLWSFSLGMAGSVVLLCGGYVLAISITGRLQHGALSGPHGFQRLFAQLAWSVLPLAFAYHVAHNLGHLLRESAAARWVFADPLGWRSGPLTAAEQFQLMQLPVSDGVLALVQVGLLVAGLWMSMRIFSRRAAAAGLTGFVARAPMAFYLLAVSAFNLWLLSQPMVMRY